MLWHTHRAALAHEADFDGFRRAARHALAQGITPEDLAFEVSEDAARVTAAASADPVGSAPALRISPALLALLEQAVMHVDPTRFELMYRLLWRVRQDPTLQHDALDPDRLQLATWAQAVRREQHKMKAFVRFRPVPEPGFEEPLHVAWFEPAHHVLRATAPFFVRRFAGMRFAILTPEASLHWDGHTLRWAGGAARDDAPGPDEGEALWLAYYAHIFNPARLKLAAMENEMPRRYWRNLPEAVLIAPLAAAAATRSGQMVQAPGTVALRRIPLAARAADAAAVPLPRPLPSPLPTGLAERQALLQDRRALTQHCRACPIGQHATQAVPGRGPLDAPLMWVGEQPGDEEDLRGESFVGPAGRLLARAMAELGLTTEMVYLTNAVKHFKYELRGKRRLHKTAAQREALACRPWLEEELALVQPKVIMALGRTAAQALLGFELMLSEARGRWFSHASGTPVCVTWHPAALLRMEPAEREAAWPLWLTDLAQARDRACRTVSG